ncbi:MAG: hypothetical protein IT329_04785 [Caldilineaceae bacterium]|nr:hypothetical protein [Caldilineaceae bacterium]
MATKKTTQSAATQDAAQEIATQGAAIQETVPMTPANPEPAKPAKAAKTEAAPAAASTDKMSETHDAASDTTTSQPAFDRERYNTEMLGKLMVELRKPFHPTQVTWKPGAMAKGGNKALALAYADLRAYQNRLDELCGANWAVSYTPWGERIVCNLTIYGVTRSSTGEADSQSERSEIAGTATEAQAFKRACAMFGLGRYLYNLPSVWAEYDGERKQFTEPAKAKLLSILVQHYRRSQETQNGDDLFEVNGMAEEAGVPASLRQEFEAMGRELYSEQWEQVRLRNVQRVSNGQARATGDLTAEQIQKLIDGMKKLKEQRAVA